MQIITHPNNKRYIDMIPQKLKTCEYHPIKYVPDHMELGAIPIVYSDLVPETVPSKTNFEDVEHSKFCDYETKCPKDWEVYFGFVRALPEPNFIIMHDHRSSINHRSWMDIHYGV